MNSSFTEVICQPIFSEELINLSAFFLYIWKNRPINNGPPDTIDYFQS